MQVCDDASMATLALTTRVTLHAINFRYPNQQVFYPQHLPIACSQKFSSGCQQRVLYAGSYTRQADKFEDQALTSRNIHNEQMHIYTFAYLASKPSKAALPKACPRTGASASEPCKATC